MSNIASPGSGGLELLKEIQKAKNSIVFDTIASDNVEITAKGDKTFSKNYTVPDGYSVINGMCFSTNENVIVSFCGIDNGVVKAKAYNTANMLVRTSVYITLLLKLKEED